MKNVHTALLIDEAFEKVQEFNYKRYISELENIFQNIPKTSSSGQKRKVNQILEKFGFHLMYENKLQELINLDHSKMGKWNFVGTLQLVLKNPDKFDKVYNILSDEDSKSTFDWFIKYRVAYAFLGELVGEISSSEITKVEFFKGINNLKL